MLRYRLRTLLILLAVGPPLIAGAWWTWLWLGPAVLIPLSTLLMIALPQLRTVIRRLVKE